MQLDKPGIPTGNPPLPHPAGASAEACLPYAGKWLSAAAVGHVMRVDKCDKAAATQQIETAVFDSVLRWVRGGNSRWNWDAKVYRDGLLKLWPLPEAGGDMEIKSLPPDGGPKKRELSPPLEPLRGGRNSTIADPMDGHVGGRFRREG